MEAPYYTKAELNEADRMRFFNEPGRTEYIRARRAGLSPELAKQHAQAKQDHHDRKNSGRPRVRAALSEITPKITPKYGHLVIEPEPEPAPTPPKTPHINVYTSLLLEANKRKKLGPMRLWLLLRTINKDGGADYERFIEKAISLGFSKRRNLVNQLKKYDGELWSIGGDRIWKYGPKQIAKIWGVERLKIGRASVPLDELQTVICGKLKHFTAAVYRWFHIARKPNPISRATIEQLTGFSPRSQRRFEKIGNVKAHLNFSIIDEYKGVDDAREYEKATGIIPFKLIDVHGEIGKQYKAYLARRLPNSYTGSGFTAGHGKQKHINEALNPDQEAYPDDDKSCGWGNGDRRNVKYLQNLVNRKSKLYQEATDGDLWLYEPQPTRSGGRVRVSLSREVREG